MADFLLYVNWESDFRVTILHEIVKPWLTFDKRVNSEVSFLFVLHFTFNQGENFIFDQESLQALFHAPFLRYFHSSAHRHDTSYSSSPHKDRSDRRFHAEKFSDSGSSRGFEYHEYTPVTGGFMTSTPQIKSQALFSPSKAYQVSYKTNLWCCKETTCTENLFNTTVRQRTSVSYLSLCRSYLIKIIRFCYGAFSLV